MKFRSIKYYIGEAVKGVIRNSLMSLSSAATVAACMFIVVFSYCIAVNVDFVLEQLENSVGITVIIDDSLTNDELNELFYELNDMDYVDSVEYISAQRALEEFAGALDTSEEIILALESDNPLRRSFSITLNDIKRQGEVIARLRSEEMSAKGVAKVREAKDVTDILSAVNNVIRILCVFIILMLALLSVIIIINTIKLTVNNRRSEINIMKYVGATDWFIKWPFVLEGVFIGVLGSFLPIVIGTLSYDGVIQMIKKNFAFIDAIMTFKEGSAIFPLLTPFVVVLGAVIGIIGSITSISKYLDV